MSPIQEEQYVIDTRRNARPGGATSHASVRKYICESCALEMGGAMGMVKAEEHARVQAEADDFWSQRNAAIVERDQAREAQFRVVAADEIADVVSETVRAELAKTVKPAPRKRATASDE